MSVHYLESRSRVAVTRAASACSSCRPTIAAAVGPSAASQVNSRRPAVTASFHALYGPHGCSSPRTLQTRLHTCARDEWRRAT